MSAQPMTGEAISLPTSPEALSPSHPPPSPSSQSPRVPARRAPARPPPSRKTAPPTEKESSPPLQVTDGGSETPPCPVALPRRPKGGEQPRKPPLRKSNTLPPEPRPNPALQNPTHKQAPPKPAPYRGSRPPPPRPQGRGDKPSEVKTQTKPPQPKERAPVVVPDSAVKTENVEAPQPKQRGKSVITAVDNKQSQPSKELETDKPETTELPQAPQRTKSVTTTVDKALSRETSRGLGKEQHETVEVPQVKQRTTAAVDTQQPQPKETNKDVEKDKTREVTPPKPRRAVPKEAVSSGSPPQPRPRAASASRPQFHKPPPPTEPSPPARTRPAPPLSSVVPSKPRPPPPSRPPAKRDSSTVEITPTEQVPKPKRRSQLLHSASAEEPPSHQSEGPTPAEKKVEPPTGESVDSSTTNTERTGDRVQKRPGKPPPPRQAKKSEGKPEGRVLQRRMTMPSKPPPPRTSTQPQLGSKVTAQEKCSGEGVNQPVAKRRMTVASEQKTGTSEGKTLASEVKSATGEGGEGKSGGEEEVKVTVKKPARRRMPMVIRPMEDEEERTSGEGKSSATTKTKKTIAGSSPKPARPPGRPTAQPSRKQQAPPKPSTPPSSPQQAAADKSKPPSEDTKVVPENKAPPKPSKLPWSPQQTADQGTDKSKAPSEETKAVPDDKLPSPQPVTIADAQVESSGSETAQPRERTEEAEEIPSHSQAHSELQKAERASATNSSVGKSEEVVEEVGVGEKEGVADGELHDATKTEEEETGVVLRLKEPAVTQLETYPKRARPMSVPAGRPGRPPKPGAPQPLVQGKTKTKPARPPGRPAQRPAQGPSRPSQPTKKAQTPVDPNAPPELPPRPGPGHILYRYVCAVPHGIALANHEPTDPSELPYEVDDVIELIEKVDNDWFYARNADLEMCEGMIPARDLRLVRKLAGESTVSGFEEGPCAVAMFTFQGQTEDELSFKEGDLIMLKTRVGRKWLRGKLVTGQEGIFPRNFVEIVEDLPEDAVDETPAPTQSQSTTEIHGPHCVAVYEFAAGGPDELCLRVGDRVELLARVGNEWLRGRLGGQEGIFPREFIEIREDLPADNRSDVLSKALYDFDGQAGELSFKAGERVRVTARVNEEWVEGETEDGGQRGMFPVSFVDRVAPDLPNKTPADTEPAQTAQSETVATGKCEALFDFNAGNSGELSFKTGDVIFTLEWVNEEWMNGRIGDREGMFPVGFVKVLEELPKPKDQKDTSKALSHLTKLDDSLLPRAEALRDFTATNSSHLSFRAGDVLNLLERISGDWYSGENTRTGDFGDFPASSVRVIEPLP
ncbi:SH3 domain-containing protein 19 [Geodia barretti]|uniref:SH3 domain-containing protein 19 n=1 Tax=Geodia barretti TaxID=519541 RepID=A0AA35TNL8_GEOBA|nr:SH3 domain-containing protein 19 [Geodia barretti]